VNPGKIGFFGGHREYSETYLECVVREVHEEISYFVPPLVAGFNWPSHDMPPRDSCDPAPLVPTWRGLFFCFGSLIRSTPTGWSCSSPAGQGRPRGAKQRMRAGW
jgi:8-oxo-dGTP pyrophosphatase MutT (NUDIX family)